MGSRNVAITEPHPSVPKMGSAYINAGRGGMGNYARYKAEDLSAGPVATGPASRTSLSKSFKRQYFIPSGRGGNGNMFKSALDNEDRMFQFDEEMSRRSDSKAPVYHIGRGGAANWCDERDASSATSSKAASRVRQDSASSTRSTTSDDGASNNVRGALNKLTRRFS